MAAVAARGPYEIAGHEPLEALERLQQGATAADVRRHGATAAVADVDLTVEQDEVSVVMGLSGSGRSTLIRMLDGLLTPTAGTVHIGEDENASLDEDGLRRVRQERLSMVFQHFALLPHRTVLDSAAQALEVRGADRAERRARASEALDTVGLGSDAGSRPGELSGGMQQRVGLARALASGPDIMLVDEAFSDLDPLIRRETQDQLQELQTSLQRTIVLITHDLNAAVRLGDRVADGHPPLPRVPLGDAVSAAVDWVNEVAGPALDVFGDVASAVVTGFTGVLLFLPPVLLVLLMGLLGVVVAALVAVPLGILAARSTTVSAVTKPVLDFMQTMPAFVDLIPGVVFFSIGVVPGLVMTVVFALPPGVRLTELGLRQVDAEVVEAGTAFGGSSRQILRGIQLPLALLTIMAGINQVIMLALSMAVIGGFIGAPGLRSTVVGSIATLNLELSFEAGISVVILAIYLDRTTSSFCATGVVRGRLSSLRSMIGRGGSTTATETAASAPTDTTTSEDVDDASVPDDRPSPRSAGATTAAR